MKNAFSIFLLLLCTFLQTPSFGQIKWSDFGHSTIYNSNDGLSSNITNDIIEDADGFLWIATGNGVSVFDGSEFTRHLYYYRNEARIPIGNVRKIILNESKDLIFIGTETGIFVSKITSVKFQPLDVVFPFVPNLNRVCGTLLFDETGTLWAGTIPGGLHKIDIKRKTYQQFSFHSNVYNNIENIWLNDIRTIKQDDFIPQLLWIGTNMGLLEFDKSTSNYSLYNYNGNKDLYHNIINEIVTTPNKIYVGSNYKGWYILDRLTKDTYQIVPDSDPEVFYTIYSLIRDDSNQLWISSPQGLKLFDIKSEKITRTQFNDRQNDKVYGFSMVDSRGIFWFCDQSGLIKYNPNYYLKELKLESTSRLQYPISVKNIIKIEDQYYVCADKSSGIYKVDGHNLNVSVLPLNQAGLRVKSSEDLLKDMIKISDDELLILGYQKSYVFNIKSGVCNEPSIQVPDSSIIFLNGAVKDLEENYWIGTNHNGLYKIDYQKSQFEQVLRPFQGKSPKSFNLIKELEIDSNNNLWIGQSSTSVLNLTSMELKCLNPEFNYSGELDFGDFLETSDRRMWIANVVDGLSYASIDNYENGLTKVKEGSFDGVYAYNDSIIWTLQKEKLELFNIKTFTSTPINISHVATLTGPIIKMDSDNFMIGTENGLLIFDPLKYDNLQELPKVYIKEVRANNNLWFNGVDFAQDKFNFPSGTKSLNIKLSALAFHDPKQISFQYKAGDSWIDLQTSKEINLSNLDQGDYSLYLRATNSLGNSSEVSKYVFKIAPYWYTSNLAFLIYILLFGGIIYALYKFNLNRKLAIAENRRVQELDDLKSKMFANISHEFRTPLTLIKGFASMITKEPEKPNIEKLSHGISENSNQLLTLINQMLDLSALDAEKMELDYKNGDIVSFIKKCVDLYRSYSESREQELEFWSERDELVMDFDDAKLQQILNNLLSNAIKFNSKGGKVVVRLEKDENQLKIKISDNGEGIRKDHIPYIFDRYYKNVDSYGGVGTGIGLSLTQDLVQLLGGSITVRSETGEGTEFTVHLPIQNSVSNKNIDYLIPFIKEDVSPLIETKEAIPERSDITILLVEDNKDILSFIKSVLRATYTIVLAENGEEGLKLASKETIHFIISDVMMPNMDGFEFCKRIKSNLSTSHIPFIMLSAKSQSTSKQQAYGLGVDAYLTKPFNIEELKLIISNLLQKKQEQQKELSKVLSLQFNSEDQLGINRLDLELMKKLQSIILGDNSKLTASQIAKKLLMSRTKLHQKVTNLTGKSLTQYANHLKIERAKQLLNKSDLQINEIAYQVGFESSTYFIRRFKKITGMSPTSFRNLPKIVDNS